MTLPTSADLHAKACELLQQKLIAPPVWRRIGDDHLEHANGEPYSFGAVFADKRNNSIKYRVFWYSDCNMLGIVELTQCFEKKKYQCIFTSKCIDEINKKIDDIWKQNTC